MMLCTKICCLFLVGLLYRNALAAVLVEKVTVPKGWRLIHPKPPGNDLARLQIGLQQRNLGQMIEGLYSVSDPDSKHYGKYYEHHQVLDLIKPSAKANQDVVDWLRKSGGVKSVKSDGHWVEFVATVETANSLLKADFRYYENVYSGVRRLRATQYSVPDNLVDSVDLIIPTTYFGANLDNSRESAALSSVQEKRKLSTINMDHNEKSCDSLFSPSCIKKAYNIGSYVPKSNSGSRVGFGNFLKQSANYKDLFEYERLFNISKQSFEVKKIHGGTNNQKASYGDIVEGNLDAQTIIAVAAGLPTVGFFTGGLPPFIPNPTEPSQSSEQNEPYIAYYKYLLNQPNENLPQVISHSYSDDEETVPIKFATRVCNMMAALGMRGISILHSSGDSGVGAACVSNDKKKTPEYSPYFPPSCPYITAVGGTQITMKKNANHEEAWIHSGGGFSNYFPRPAYQKKPVRTYLSQHISQRTQKYIGPFFNHTGRGIPDISARADGAYRIVIQGQTGGLTGGTSASVPVVAGIIALLNDARLRNGQSALGFLNPFLYKHGAEALNDIKTGGSIGCTGDLKGAKTIPFASWNATEGWDPVTGLGTPNFGKLRTKVLNLP